METGSKWDMTLWMGGGGMLLRDGGGGGGGDGVNEMGTEQH